LYDCPPDILDNKERINEALREAVEYARATLLKQVSNQFSPQGVTALGILAESHISIHTWPEHGYAAVDIFTCGNRAMPERACSYLVDALYAGNHTLQRIERGTLLDSPDIEFVPKPVATVETVEA
jgi:S-adenosylmethionine decarboxylase